MSQPSSRIRSAVALFVVSLLWASVPVPFFGEVPLLQAQEQAADKRKAEADRLKEQGIQQFQRSEFQGAIQSWQQALQLYQTLGDREGEGRTLNNLGGAYFSLGEYAKAIEFFQQSLAIAREIGDRTGEGRAIGNLGNIYSSVGDYAKAIEFFQQSLVLAREIGDRAVERAALNNIGLARHFLGKYEQAIEVFQQALALSRETGDRQGEGSSLTNLGAASLSLGEYDEAIEFFQQSLAIQKEIGDRVGEERSLMLLGGVSLSLGEYAKAIELFQQSLVLAREIGDRVGESNSLTSLGKAYNAVGKYPNAAEFYQQALAIQRAIGQRIGESQSWTGLGNIHLDIGESEKAVGFYHHALVIQQEIGDRAGESYSLGNLGLAYSDLGEYETAVKFHQLSLAIQQEIGDRAGEGRSLNNLGLAYSALKEYEKALEFHQQSLTLAREIGDRASEGKALNNLGLAHYRLNQLPQAEANLFNSLEVKESIRAQLGDSDANKIAIFETQANTYRLLQQVLIAQNKSDRALEIAERGRARAFVELLSQRLSPKQSDTAPEPPTLEQIKQIAQEQNATLVEYSIVDSEFEIDGKKQVKPSQLYIWVVKPAGEVSFRTVDLAEMAEKGESLSNLVARSRSAMGVRGRGLVAVRASSRGLQQENRLRQLHQLLIEPIADLLPTDPEEKVIFLPQGPFFLVPFPALQDESERYLIEKHTILTAPAIQVLQLTREQRKGIGSRESGVGEVLVVGNPTMPSVAVEIGETPTQLQPLPGAEREAKDIAQFLNVQPLIGDRATRAAVVRQMPQARIIHLATHGLLDDFKGQGIPGAYRQVGGAIALAPDGTGKRNDGLLTANEILDLNLSAELVVLSACDTGRGEITGDGVIGLSRSLIVAGVPSVVVSLWAVDDDSTAFLMSEFYRNLEETGDKAQSLRQAMLATKEKYPQPQDWAAFTLMGESE